MPLEPTRIDSKQLKTSEGTPTLSERFKSLVALPTAKVPDPFDVEANAAQPLMGPSDIIPEWIERKFDSKLAGFAASFISPVQLGKNLASKLGIIGTRSVKAGMPKGLKDKLTEVAKKKGYTKKSQLIDDPDNWWVDPDTNVTYSLSLDRGTIFAVPAKDIQGNTGIEKYSNWAKKATEASQGRPLTDAEWVQLGPRLKKMVGGDHKIAGEYSPSTNEVKIRTDNITASKAKIKNTGAHELSHATEHTLQRYGDYNPAHVSRVDPKTGQVQVLPEALGSNTWYEVTKLLQDETVKNGRNFDAMSDGAYLRIKATKDNIDESIRQAIDNNATLPEEILPLYEEALKTVKDPLRAFDKVIKDNPILAKNMLGEDFLHGFYVLPDKAYKNYRNNPGEVLARRAGALAEESEVTSSFENYKQNLNLLSDEYTPKATTVGGYSNADEIARQLERLSWTPEQVERWGSMGKDPLSFMESQLESAKRAFKKHPSQTGLKFTIKMWEDDIATFKKVNKIKE